jgi:anti-sigma regulatory factor (Ser/Thr protein kinase)
MATSTSSALDLTSASGESRPPLCLETTGGPGAPARVRTWLQEAAGWLPEGVERNLELLTCELVNNSVVHGEAGERDVIKIEVRATSAGVRAEVSDPGPGFMPAARNREMDEPGGWGLVLVERISKAWGVERDGRTRVWFELALAG